jgi:hypothetical protein
MNLILGMVFMSFILSISWSLQDAGQQLAGALLFVVSLALVFVLQVVAKR